MPQVANKMENNYDEKFIVMKAADEYNKQEMKSNKQESDEKMKKLSE